MDNQELYKPSGISRWLLWCSGVPYEELSGCSRSERWMHEWQGALMWVPPLMAVVSMANLLKSMFGIDGNVRFLYAALYGLLIFALERGLIISLGHPLSRRSHLLSPALYVRLVLALVFAFAVALPLKLELSKGTIAEVLSDDRETKELKLDARIERIVAVAQGRVDAQEAVVQGFERDLIGEVNGTSGSGERGYSTNARLVGATLKDAKATRDSLKAALGAVADSLGQWKAREMVIFGNVQAKDLTAQVKALGKAAAKDHWVAFISALTIAFFLFIELIPILIKLLGRPGELAVVMDRKKRQLEDDNEVLKRSSVEGLGARIDHHRKVEAMTMRSMEVKAKVEGELQGTRYRVKGDRVLEKIFRKHERALTKVTDPKRAARYKQLLEAYFDRTTGRMEQDDKEKAA